MMEIRRWIWIPLLLQGLVWALVFVSALFGFAETFVHAPEAWWDAHAPAYWLLLAGGLLCMTAHGGVVRLARRADRFARRRVAASPVARRLFGRVADRAGGLLTWGLWLGALAAASGAVPIARPEIGVPAALLGFAPVELCLWALACGLGPLTALAIVDRIADRDPERGVLAVLLHLVCYVWFYVAAGGPDPAGNAWAIAALAALAAAPTARLPPPPAPDGAR